MEKRDIPRPGEFYRHFKNRLYQIIAVAYDAETEQQAVVYQALYGDYRVWVRPLENFLSRTDREKYPEASQEWRFERVQPAEAAPAVSEKAVTPAVKESPAQAVSSPEGPAQEASGPKGPAQAVSGPEGPAQAVPGQSPAQTVPGQSPAQAVSVVEDDRTGTQVLLAFLDAETREEKKAALVSGMDRLTQRELDSIYMALAIPAQEGDVRSQVSGILSWMKTQERSERRRLRDGRQGIITRKV